jgi:hypothetical protein
MAKFSRIRSAGFPLYDQKWLSEKPVLPLYKHNPYKHLSDLVEHGRLRISPLKVFQDCEDAALVDQEEGRLTLTTARWRPERDGIPLSMGGLIAGCGSPPSGLEFNNCKFIKQYNCWIFCVTENCTKTFSEEYDTFAELVDPDAFVEVVRSALSIKSSMNIISEPFRRCLPVKCGHNIFEEPKYSEFHRAVYEKPPIHAPENEWRCVFRPEQAVEKLERIDLENLSIGSCFGPCRPLN